MVAAPHTPGFFLVPHSATVASTPTPPGPLPFHRDWRYYVCGELAMSQYTFHCDDCNKEFSRTLHMSEAEKGGVTCPHCGSKNVNQLVTAFSAVTSRKS